MRSKTECCLHLRLVDVQKEKSHWAGNCRIRFARREERNRCAFELCGIAIMSPDFLARGISGGDGDSPVDRRSLKRLAAKAVALAPRILAFVAAALFLWLFLRFQWRIGDEGSIVYGASRVTEGAVPSRDFLEVMGPGTFYWLALWFKVFGTTWLTSRVAILVTVLISTCAIYYATRRQYRGRLAVVPAALYTIVSVPSWPGASHHFDSNMWVLLAVAASVSALQPNRKTSVLTGVLAGLGATSMPQKGVLVLAGLCIARLIEGARSREWRRAIADTLWMVGPFLAVGATVALYFWSRDALWDLIQANVIWPATRYRSVNGVPYAFGFGRFAFGQFAPVLAAMLPASIAGIAITLAAVPFLFIVVLPFAAVALLLYGMVAPKQMVEGASRVPWAYWCAGFGLFAAECHRADMMHLIWGSPVLLVAVFIWTARTKGLLAVTVRRTLACCVALLAAVLVLTRINPTTTTMKTRSGEIQLLSEDDALRFLHESVSAEEQVFVYPYYPMYYFLANVRNPTRFSILMYHYNTSGEFDEVVQDLENGQVQYVLWDTSVGGANLVRWFPGYEEPPVEEQRLERYLEEHYKVIATKNKFRVLQRM
jgi:hypothetical protein